MGVTYDCAGPAPFHLPYIKVHLENRKGWQKKQGWDGDLKSKSITTW